MTSKNGIKLTQREVLTLATAMVAERLADCGAWAHWELVPLIDEDSYYLVLAEIENVYQSIVVATSAMGGNELMQRVS